jgi:hypothetical protein
LDSCMVDKILLLDKAGVQTVASCCGHGKYPESVIIRDGTSCTRDLISGRVWSVNESRFYKMDYDGLYRLEGSEVLPGGEEKGRIMSEHSQRVGNH